MLVTIAKNNYRVSPGSFISFKQVCDLLHKLNSYLPSIGNGIGILCSKLYEAN